MEKIRWDFRKIRWNVLWAGLAPLGLFTFLIGLFPITGNLFAPLLGQSAWGKVLVFPWVTLFSPVATVESITTFDQVLVILYLILSVICLYKLPSKSLGIYCLLSMSAFLFSGSLLSASRYLLVLFPIIILLSIWGKNRFVDRAVLMISIVFLAILMTAWTQFYWVA
jgi:hypothetical protein